MYGVHRRTWVAVGGPVAPPTEARDLASSFCELADANGGYPVFYQVAPDQLPMYVDLGMTLRKLGESARVPLQDFTLNGGTRKWLRRAMRDGERAGLTVVLVEPPHSPVLIAAVRAVSADWLARRRTREKGFSLGYADPEYLGGSPLALVWLGERLVAFANLWRSGGREELSVDLMRYSSEAPHGVMDFLFGHLMLMGRDQGYRWFNLGMAPLSGLELRSRASLWSRVGAMLFRHGEHFYNFQGLRHYKEKFDPQWSPRYLVAPGGLVLPRVLTDIATLISGGLRGMVTR
jgi:phosphatidylglycerol lysyltransferase